MNPPGSLCKNNTGNKLSESTDSDGAKEKRISGKTFLEMSLGGIDSEILPADLRALFDAWHALPERVKSTILILLVESKSHFTSRSSGPPGLV